MKYQHIVEFDPSRYQSTRRLCLAEAASLAKQLASRVPIEPPPAVHEAAQALREQIDLAEAAMVDRLRRGSLVLDASAIEFAIEGVWLFVRASLERWSYLDSEGFVMFEDDDYLANEIDLTQFNEAIELAIALDQQLSGTPGAAPLLLTLQADAVADPLTRLVAGEIVPLLRAAQRGYDAMVREQLDASAELVELRTRRHQLLRVIQFYANAVIAMIGVGGVETIATVEDALAPLAAHRARPSQAKWVTDAIDTEIEIIDGIEQF